CRRSLPMRVSFSSSGCKLPSGTPAPSSSTRGRRAATTVEFAVIAPIYFMLILAIIEFGRTIMIIHLLNNAARVGCRTGIIEVTDTATIVNATNNYLESINIRSGTTTVRVNGDSADASTAQAKDEITVNVSIPVSEITWVPGTRFTTGYTLSGQFTLRR